MKPKCACIPLLAVLSLPAFSQSTDATLSGSILDPSGKNIPGAEVEIFSEATGLRYSGKSNSAGIYTLTALPPGRYRIQVSRTGFKTVITPDIVLNVQSAGALNFTLPVGAASESITVEGTSALLNTIDASVSTVIDQKFVENMPLNGRSFQDLISMTPGVVTQSPQNTGQNVGLAGDFSVNGQRTDANYYTVDGVAGNISGGYPTGRTQSATGGSIAATTALGTTQSLIPVDALQEFRVSSSSYSAEYGRSPGGQFAMSTRSGTNALHGTAYDYLRNDVFDANNWFNNHNGLRKTAIRQNDFGATLGGPIRLAGFNRDTNRSFFFVSYEGLRLTQPTAAAVQYVPALSVREGTVAALKPIFNAFPLPTGPEIDIACTTAAANCPKGSQVGTQVSSGMAPFVKAYSLPASIDSTSARIDHTVSDKLSLFFRFGYSPTSSTSRTLSFVIPLRLNTMTYTFGATSQLSSRLSNDFRVGYAQGNSFLRDTLDNFGGAQPIDLAAATGIPSSYVGAQPEAYLNVAGVGTSYIYTLQSSNKLAQWNVTDTVQLTDGHHALKMGIDWRRFHAPTNPAPLLSIPTFTTKQGMLSNVTSSIQLTKWIPSDPVISQFGAFFQDTWRLRPTLALSLGARWDVAPPPTEANGNAAYTLLGQVQNPATLSLAPRGTALWHTVWTSIAPRVGLAWTLDSTTGWETVLRGGGGVFYDTGSQVATLGYSGLGFQASRSYSGAALPITASQLNFSTDPVAPYTNAVVYAFPSRLQPPYTLQWNVAVQQALGRGQTITASYVASAGRRLLQQRMLSVAAYNPNFNSVAYFPGGITSRYDALQLSFQRSVAKGLQGLVSYTWSHSLDFGSTSTSFPALYGNSDYDLRNTFQAGLAWDLPSRRGQHRVNKFLNGWGLDGRLNVRGAFPIPLTGNTLYDATGSAYYSGVNYDRSRSLYLYGAQYPGGRALNGGANNTISPALTLPTAASSGNAPRNFARAFGANQINTALRRQFQLHEKVALQFRAEAFNVLNHSLFGYVNPSLTSATFGQATKTLNQSLASTSSIYQQGGPRSLQFALKLIF